MVLYANDPTIDLHLAQHVRPTSIGNMYSIMNRFWNAAAGRYAVMPAQQFPTLNAMVPRNDLRFGNSQYVLAVAGQSDVAYSAAATSNLGVERLVANARYERRWLDTEDGSTVVQSSVLVTTARTSLPRPATIQPEAALYIQKR